jgi:hypothetical protein
MNCARCQTAVLFHPKELFDPNHFVMDGRSHADIEPYAYTCKTCGKIYCGSCCLPKWNDLKRKHGLGGKELAAKLNADPNALFTEVPKCPECKASVEMVSEENQPITEGARALNVLVGIGMTVGGGYLLADGSPVWGIGLIVLGLVIAIGGMVQPVLKS